MQLYNKTKEEVIFSIPFETIEDLVEESIRQQNYCWPDKIVWYVQPWEYLEIQEKVLERDFHGILRNPELGFQLETFCCGIPIFEKSPLLV